MHQLVPQNVQPIEQDREDPGGIMLAQGVLDGSPASLKLLLPIRMAWDPVLVLPERVIDIPII